ncbi:MAG: hypothetical protein KatS3mg014_2353 [Actinomycetota bacterium]|nr:MAG: hypothetical protein KatS3mg014_2353 [Actinomycetota bacterium]
MSRYLKVAAFVAVLALAAVACGGGGGGGQTGPTGPTVTEEIQPGGTLRVWMDTDVTAAFDPQKEYFQVSFAFYRCCLLRTLLSYNGKGPEEDGDKVFPDLAAEMPTVSADGLTWTFKLKQGLHYAPPLQDVEITAQDFIRAMMRTAKPEVAAGYSFYYSVIEGFDDFAAGKADTITGMRALDDYTLEIKLTEPAGDLGYRFAMPATAPIPPNPADPEAPLGVAEGHDDDYGRFLVASGPYMFEGSEDLDFSVPAKDQEPVAGYQPDKLISLVRNPSWVADDQDDLRPAYVDAISVEICPGCDQEVAEEKVANDEIDHIFTNGVSAQTARKFSQDPELQDQYFVEPGSGNYYISMNLAVPPFDDIHVRKAVNYAINKEGVAPAVRRRGLRRDRRLLHAARAARQPPRGVRPVRDPEPRGGGLARGARARQAGDGAVEVRHEQGRDLRRAGVQGRALDRRRGVGSRRRSTSSSRRTWRRSASSWT